MIDQDATLVDSAKVILTAIFSVIVGYFGKVFYDYSKEGRIEKTSIYVNKESCESIRERCIVEPLKDKITAIHAELKAFEAETRSHQKETDRCLSENTYDIRAMREDITVIKETQAHSNALLETIVTMIKHN